MGKIHEFDSQKISGGSRHPVHKQPVPHIRRETREPLKTWSGSYQSLPMPRLLLNPYVGCSAGCDFCFIKGFPGLYDLAEKDGVLTVFSNYPQHVKKQIQRLRIAPPVLLSPYTDPFQPLNDRYQLAEKLVKECVMQGLPVEIVTRYHVPDEVVAMLRHLPTSRIQVSVDPFQNEGDVPHYLERLDMMARLHQLEVDAVLRVDPLFPPEDEVEEALVPILSEAEKRGIQHVVVGFGQSPSRMYSEIVDDQTSRYEQVRDGIGWWKLSNQVRKSILETVRSLTGAFGQSLGVLGIQAGQEQYGDGQQPFPTMLPMSTRRSAEEPFRPVEDCGGNCLTCPEAVCGVEELRDDAEAHRGVTIADWDEWGQSRQQEQLRL